MANRDYSSYRDNYGYSKEIRKPMSHLFDMRPSAQDESYFYNDTEQLSYNAGCSSQDYRDKTPLHNKYDSRCDFNTIYSSPAWKEISYDNLEDISLGSYGTERYWPDDKAISELFDKSFDEKFEQFERHPQKSYSNAQDSWIEPQNIQETPVTYSDEQYYDLEYRNKEMSDADIEQTELGDYQEQYFSGRIEHRGEQQKSYKDNGLGYSHHNNFRYEPDSESNSLNYQDRSRYEIQPNICGSNQSNHVRIVSYEGSFEGNNDRQDTEGFSRQRQFKKRGFHFQEYEQIPQESQQYSRKEPPFRNRYEQVTYRDSDEGQSKKVDSFPPDPALIEKYRFYAPPALELGKIFDDLVIFCFYKVKNIPENHPFVLICESFNRSAHYSQLKVEDGYEFQHKLRKFCTLRWNDMMLVRGVSETGNLKEARVCAAVQLIKNLTKSCYTLKMRDDYYSNAAFQGILDVKQLPGVFRVVTPEEAPDADTACQYIDDFFRKDSDCELVFTDQKLILPIKLFARQRGYDTRIPKAKYVVVFKRRTPQYWRNIILASGKMENEKFYLYPPQGLGNNLPENFKIDEVIPGMKQQQNIGNWSNNLYGPKGIGPHIIKAVVPWSRGKFSKRKRTATNKRKTRLNKGFQQGRLLKTFS